MAIRDKASAKWKEMRDKIKDKEAQRKIKGEIQKRLKQGKEVIQRLEKELRDPENRKKAEDQLAKAKAQIAAAKAKLEKLKVEFKKKEKQAVDYTLKNPEKALAVAAAAGALAGALWMAIKRKK